MNRSTEEYNGQQRKFERTIRKQKRRILVDEATGDKEKLLVDQVKLQRLKQEYARFSKGVGLPAQHARMEAAGFDWKKGRTAEKQYVERVADVGEKAAALNWHTIPVAGGKTVAKYRRISHNFQNGGLSADAANQKIDVDITNTNLAFNSGNPGYRQNCQRCVATYEMRRRGYDVIARPAVVGDDGKLSEKDPLYNSWRNIFEGAKFEFHSGYDGGKSSIISQMDKWGDGAVAEVRVVWRTSEAHVFVAQRINGVVRFIDPQNGSLNCEEYFTKVELGATMIARIDNLKPTALIEKCIKNRGGKQ